MALPRRWAPLTGTNPLELSFLHGYRLVRSGDGWSVHSTSYHYQVRLDNTREILAFHWHPEVEVRRGERVERIAWPHMHAETLEDPACLADRHIPSGRVSIEAVVRFLIDELRVEPQLDNWRDVLAENEATLADIHTWGMVPPAAP